MNNPQNDILYTIEYIIAHYIVEAVQFKQHRCRSKMLFKKADHVIKGPIKVAFISQSISWRRNKQLQNYFW